MTIKKIENIFPAVDENKNDILKFTIDGKQVSERISSEYDINQSDDCDLVTEWGVDKEDAKAINSQLQVWVDEHKDERFARPSQNPLVQTIEYGIRASKDEIAVFLTDEGCKELSITSGYSIANGAVASYDSLEFGSQDFDNSDVNEPFSKSFKSFYDTPENLVGTISERHDQFRDEAKEVLDDRPEHYVLTWDSTDRVNGYGENGRGSMSGGEYRSKAEALAAIDEVRQNMIDAGSGDDAEREYIENGTFSVSYVGPSEFVSNIRVEDNDGQLFAEFDVKTIDENGDEQNYSTGEWIDLDDGLLVSTGSVESNIYAWHDDSEFDREEVMGQVNNYLRNNPIAEHRLEDYRESAAEAEAENQKELERMVAS